MNHRLFKILVCPVCHGKLQLDEQQQRLYCPTDTLSYYIKDQLPVLINEQATEVNKGELTV